MATTEVMNDVVIIGAGVAGLAAAHSILKQDPSVKLIILEAKDRVGGRTLTTEVELPDGSKEKFDLGGQWVSVSQTHIMDLIKEFGLDTYQQFATGTKVMQVGKEYKVRTYASDIPSLGSWFGLVELQLFINKVEKLCKKVPIEDPYSSPLAAKYDGVTLESITRKYIMNQAARETIECAIRVVIGADLSNVGALFFLAYANAAGGVMNLLLANEGQAQELRVKGGTQQISEKLAEKVGLDKIHFQEPVTQIVQNHKEVWVTTASGKTFHAQQVICAAPPHFVTKMHLSPPLPETRQFLLDNLPVGHLSKFTVIYDKAYWKEAGFSGEIVSNGGRSRFKNCHVGPLGIVYDATTYNNVPALVGFIAGRQSVEWCARSAEERKKAVLDGLAECLGAWAITPVRYLEKNWFEEPYSGGCPVNYGVPGIMYAFLALRQPHGRILWAGTETATRWVGYMSGAAQSGLRAAYQVLKRLGKEPAETPESSEWKESAEGTQLPS